MSLRVARQVYRPFFYPEAFEYFQQQQQSHWIPSEVSLGPDVADFTSKLTHSEKSAVVNILRLFTQVEIGVEEYWSNRIMRWFPHPEIQQMASAFGAMEGIHIWAYSYLNDSLGLPESDYSVFLQEPSMRAKLDRMKETIEAGDSDADVAKSLAVFSAFTEGVALFSSFAILMNFGRFNKLKGLGQIVAWSSRDESLHSKAGCWLFRKFIEENPEMWTDELKKSCYQAARDVVEMEDAYLEQVFSAGEIEGLSVKQLKAYIRHRANTKLGDIGLKMNWKNLDKDDVVAITSWLDPLMAGVEHKDFFGGRVTSYSKGHVDWSRTFLKVTT